MALLINNMEQVLEKFSVPNSLVEARFRMKQNLRNFNTKYAVVTLFILFLSLLGHPISMFPFINFVFSSILVYFYDEEPLVLFNRCTVNVIAILGFVGICTIWALLVIGVWMNVLVSILIGCAIAVIHATFRTMDGLYFDEEGLQMLEFIRNPNPYPMPTHDPHGE